MQVFTYPDVGAGIRQQSHAEPSPDAATPEHAPAPVPSESIEEAIRAAYAEGMREGRQQAMQETSQAVAQEKARVTEAIKQFETQVAEYYARVEIDVVKLAMAIASKILHRESQIDPLLVAALVRVTLEKFHKNTKAVVRVRPEEASGWRQYLAQHMEQAGMPEVIEDDAVQPHNCILETELGSTELGIEPQLKEIETGLFDLLAQRPEAK
jgi:flagellar assembly protein FliH